MAFTKFARQPHCAPAFVYRPGDWLVFGSETAGLSDAAHAHVDATGGARVRIPMVQRNVRSLNLSVSAGIGCYEALRQLDEAAGRVSDAYADEFGAGTTR